MISINTHSQTIYGSLVETLEPYYQAYTGIFLSRIIYRSCISFYILNIILSFEENQYLFLQITNFIYILYFNFRHSIYDYAVGL